ncbi:MAG: hypothetical protein HC865_17205 [Cyanobacteria bacterium RU_5_0]|nr:hypothetical protein [Cyanobacteria bacterium RU_5_0]
MKSPNAQANSQQSLSQAESQTEPDLDNTYHEDDSLPDDADIFPRMGKTEDESGEYSNCRSTPWGTVVASFPGGAFIEIGDRTVDQKGESWFRSTDLGCWIHDNRIDLL